jgi:hypothetical protein
MATPQEAITKIRDYLGTHLQDWELQQLSLWSGKCPCFGKRIYILYYSRSLRLVEKVERIMAWKWPAEYGTAYCYPPPRT